MALKKSTKNKKKYYVDPKEFEKHILKFYKNGKISTELGQSIYDIANRLGYAPNFINYTYKEEMVGDAILKMLHALRNKKFNPKRGNPFSYFTKIAFNAFCNRIKKEKRERDAIQRHQEEVYDSLVNCGYIPDDQQNNEHFNNTDTIEYDEF